MAQRRRPRSGRRRTVLLTVALLGGTFAVLLALAGLRLMSAARDLRTAASLVDDAGAAIEEGRLRDARDALRQALPLLTAANGDLHGRAELALLSVLPPLADDLAQLRESVGIASTIVNGGERILAAAAPLESADGELEVPLSEGTIPLDAVRAAGREADLLAGALPGEAESRTRTGLLGPVAELRDRVADEATQRKHQLDVLASGLELLTDMAGGNGERRYLIAVANTAEMRGSGGMVLSYGTLVGSGGDFELEDFGRIDELRLDGPIPEYLVPVPADYLARWDGFDPLLLWRNANLAADLTISAPVLETMFAAATGAPAAGVIQIDPEGLAAILEGVGPVEVAGLGTVTADNVVDLVLHDAYVQYPDTAERSDVLGDVAEAVFRELVEGEYDSLRPLAEALLKAVDGRHLLMHSAAAGPQHQLSWFGADGSLPEVDGADAVHLTVQNVSANKLDYYLDTSLALTGDRPAGEVGHVQATITVANTAPPGATEPRFVFGPFNDDQQAGLYRGSVSLYLPAGTRLVGAGGDPLPDPPALQTEGGRPVVGFHVDVPAGAARTVVLELELPPRPADAYELLVIPSARVRPTALSVDLAGADGISGSVTLDRPWRFRLEAPPAAIAPRSGRVPVGRGGT